MLAIRQSNGDVPKTEASLVRRALPFAGALVLLLCATAAEEALHAQEDPAPARESTPRPGLAPTAATQGAKASDDKPKSRKERRRAKRARRDQSSCGTTATDIDQRYQRWLEEQALLLTPEERDSFLCLHEDYQRDAFIEEFWKVRDPYPDTARNELKEQWEELLLQARQLFGGMDDPRTEFYLINGPPPLQIRICPAQTNTSLEAWFYGFGSMSEVIEAIYRKRIRRGQFAVIFHQHTAAAPWRMWYPGDRFSALDDISRVDGGLGAGCDRDAFQSALAIIRMIERMGGSMGFYYEQFIARKLEPPEPASDEWLLTFDSYSTDLPEGVPLLEANFEASYPGSKGQRTIMQVAGFVDVTNAVVGDVLGTKSYALELIGEVLRADEADGAIKLFEKFRYRFDLPEDELDEQGIPIAIQRYLRPGTYKLLVRIDDLHGNGGLREEIALDVPAVDHLPPRAEGELAEIYAEANRRLSTGEPSIKLVIPDDDLKSGYLRFDTAITGDIDHVVFSLDDRPILTKRRPPFSVDLDLGHLPKSQLLRATAYDADDERIASDAFLINGSPHRFRVELLDPIPGASYQQSVRVQADVTVPENDRLERVEIYRNDDLVATLFQPPIVHVMDLPAGPALTVVRAVAYKADGTYNEDTVIINGPATLEEVSVDFVELYTSVTDAERRPLLDLQASDFRILEDGVAQEIVRFEKVDDTPIRGVTLLDISASMEERLDKSVQAAADFFKQVVTERDELAVVTFNDRPLMAATFTNETEEFAQGLLGLRAERGTALYDSLIFTLYQLNGLPGQRVLVLLSDGQDEHSRFTYDDALEYAQRSQATIYTIGLALPTKVKSKRRGGKRPENPRKVLRTIAEQTGGQSFFVEDVSGLQAIYEQIARELRTKYLIAYQSSNTSSDGQYREIEVELSQKDAEARTIRGYYP